MYTCSKAIFIALFLCAANPRKFLVTCTLVRVRGRCALNFHSDVPSLPCIVDVRFVFCSDFEGGFVGINSMIRVLV